MRQIVRTICYMVDLFQKKYHCRQLDYSFIPQVTFKLILMFFKPYGKRFLEWRKIVIFASQLKNLLSE